jgi:predicted DNA-binding protein
LKLIRSSDQYTIDVTLHCFDESVSFRLHVEKDVFDKISENDVKEKSEYLKVLYPKYYKRREDFDAAVIRFKGLPRKL